MTDRRIDVVYTWVDDTFDGYADTLRHYAGDGHDTNPNRTRDNLDVLKYSLRSIETFLPQVRRVYLLTCRPQVPHWLNPEAPGLRLVHHDEVMAPEILPTFNSFAIISHLHLLPGLSDEFVYFEDDMLLLRSGLMASLMRGERPLSLFHRRRTRPLETLDPQRDSPWNHALARSDAALSRVFGPRRRNHVIHGPQRIDRGRFAQMTERFADEFATTRAARFRSTECIAPEYLYPHYAHESGAAEAATQGEVRAVEGYVSLENFTPWTWAQLRRLGWRNPVSATLNDSFGDKPNPRVERMVKRWLEERFPAKSRFER
ncbi:Stealth protein CR3, conserved region 3 [Salinihabitans flavidus]|uniref:Stealth protein CR3, conserved region 3 n=1 Tax=Salinihabitans flavidus TaxID=569882 RepID=A0A1H8SK21_9RHOB|nr:stealth conserved region 3 domain-containing protein [Salinihabitans flavidus]SEO79349.1 Stealth protein CR3, conserved region 3 [Salinihabitans flavidus]